MDSPFIKALYSIRPLAAYTFSGGSYNYTELVWLDSIQVKPTDAEIQAEMQKQVRDVYKAKRQKEYPALEDFVDAYYWAQHGDSSKLSEYLTNVTNVKNKYPKGD